LTNDVLDDPLSRLAVTYDPLRAALLQAAQSAFQAGFLGRQMPELSNLYDLKLLNEVLAEKGKNRCNDS